MDVTCRTWRDDEELWRPASSCKMEKVTESGDVVFKSNLFGSLAAGLFVGPNKIDFGTVFQNLDKKIVENIIVVATVLGIILLYIPCAVICRHMDKADTVKWQGIMIVGDAPEAEYEYEVHVYTGRKSCASTKSKVFINIKGTLGSTGPRALTDGSEQHFKGGQVKIFKFRTTKDLGDLLYVNVWHDNSGDGDYSSWYLDKVVVVDMSDLMWYVFWCNDWLAVEEGDGKLERNLIVESYDLNMNSGALMRNNVQRNLFDTHLWFSVVVRPSPSRFTRVQRLSVCLALLYLTMITNAMFYKTGEATNTGSISIGPIRVGVHELYVSVISSLIVIPPIVLIVMIFTRIAPRPRKSKENSDNPVHTPEPQVEPQVEPMEIADQYEDPYEEDPELVLEEELTFEHEEDLQKAIEKYRMDENEDEAESTSESEAQEENQPDKNENPDENIDNLNANNNNGNTDENFDEIESKKRWKRTNPSRQFPWWALYIGWVLVFLSVALSAFFVLLYSFQWGRVVSTAWLAAFFLSFFESVVLVQPLKVLMVAVLLSFILKRDADVNQYEEQYGKMLKPEDSYDEEYGVDNDTHTGMSEEQMELIRERRELDKKSNSMLKEIVKHVLITLLLVTICYINVDPRVYHQSQHLRQSFDLHGDNKLATLEDIWKWLENHALENVYFTKKYNNNPVTTYDSKFMVDGNYRRLSPPRIRQVRADPEPCRIPLYMQPTTKRCTFSYLLQTEDRRSFKDAPWHTPMNKSEADTAAQKVAKSKLTDSYQYTTYVPTSYIDGLHLWGLFSTYSGGGYIVNLGPTLQTATDAVQKIKQMKWLDERTRAVLLEFNIYNANTNLFSLVTVLVETTTWGGIYPTITAQTLLLYRYNGAVGFLAIVTEIICIIWVIYKTIYIIIKMVKLKKNFFLDIWNWVETSVIVALIFGFIFYILRSYWTIKKVEQMMNNKEQSVNFGLVVMYDNLYMTGLGYAAFATIIRFLHILRYNKTIADLSAILYKGAWDMIILGLWGISILVAFSILIHSAMGTKIKEYAAPGTTIFHMVTSFLGHFDFETVEEEGGNWGRIILLIYLLIMMFLIVNIFITVINETIGDIGEDELPTDYKVMEYFLDNAKALIFGLLKMQGDDKDEEEEADESNMSQIDMSNMEIHPTNSPTPFQPFHPPKPRTEDFNFYFMKKFSRLKSIPFSKDSEDSDMMLLYLLMSYDRRKSNSLDFYMALSQMKR